MKTYRVGMDVFQILYFEFDAETPEEAEEKAYEEFAQMNEGDFSLHGDVFETEELEDEE